MVNPARKSAAPPHGTLLGFDFGTRRTGVAVGQTVTRSASPLVTVETGGRRPDWAPIDTLIEEWRPVALLVGVPLNMDGTENEMTEQAARFMRQLQSRYRLPTHGVDERLTSIEAERRLAEAGAPVKRRRRELDRVAAQLIIETWFAENGAST